MNADGFAVNSTLLVLAGVLVAALVLVIVVVGIVRNLLFRPPETSAPPPPTGLAVASLPPAGPPHSGPDFQFYGTPVRLSGYVIAPVGRSGEIPADDRLADVVDHLIPGMTGVIAAHRPIIRVWPPQISSQGFTAAFFNKAPLPGDRGKGTPWCSAAGKFSSGGRQYLVGVLCCAAEANGLSQVIVEHDGKWHDVLRVRS